MAAAKCQPRKDYATALSIRQVLNGTDLLKYAHTYVRCVLIDNIQGICSCMRTHLLLSSEAVAPKNPPHLLLFLLLWVAFHHVRQGRLVQRLMVFQVLWSNDIRDTFSILRTCMYNTLSDNCTHTEHIYTTQQRQLFALFTTLTLH